MKIKVIYLARLAEDLGKKEEYIELESSLSIQDLFMQLNLSKFRYKIYSAKNYEHSDFNENICDGDEIAFFPTITGG
jgi:molybdopterin converting factor small subunit